MFYLYTLYHVLSNLFHQYQNYPLNKDTYLILKNARICCGCNSRYLEFKEEKYNESLERDAKTIRKKLGI